MMTVPISTTYRIVLRADELIYLELSELWHMASDREDQRPVYGGGHLRVLIRDKGATARGTE